MGESHEMSNKHPLHRAVPVLSGNRLVGYLHKTFSGWNAYSHAGTLMGVYDEDRAQGAMG